jgi:sigma-E factor negative regulatory protein RseA
LLWRPVANWLKPVAGGAIAAGVAAVALVSLRISPDLPKNETAQVSAPPPSQARQLVADEVRSTSETLPRYTVPMDNANRAAPPIQVINGGRLANFVMAHSEYSLPLGQRNMLTSLLVDEPTSESADGQATNSQPPVEASPAQVR